MPIVIKDYTWRESDDRVTIEVPLKGSGRRPDVSISDVYVKVNAPPFFFEADLHAAIDPAASRVSIQPGMVALDLAKAAPGAWLRLQTAETDKGVLRERRAAAEERLLAAQRAQDEARAQARSEEQRASVRAQVPFQQKAKEKEERRRRRKKER